MKCNILFYYLFALLTFVSLFSCSKKSHADKPFIVKVAINENDCFRCYGGMYVFQELSKVSRVEFVFRDLGENEIQRFLDNNGIDLKNDIFEFDIISNSSLYDSLNNYNITEIHVYNKEGLEFYDFPMASKSIGRIINEIKAIGFDLTQRELPRLELKYVSNYYDLSVSDFLYLITNPTMNYCEVFDKKGHSLYTIDALQIDPLELYPEMKKYDRYTNYMKEIGAFFCRIESAQLMGEEVWLDLLVPFIDVRNDSIIHIYKNSQVSFSAKGGKVTHQILFDSRETPIYTIGDAGDEKGYFGIGMSTDEEMKFEYKCYKMQRTLGKLEIVDTKEISLSDFDRIPRFAYLPKVKNGFLALSYSDFLVDLEQDTVYSLPIHPNPQITSSETSGFNVSTDGLVKDWAYDGKNLAVVYYDTKLMQYQYLYKNNQTKETNSKPLLFEPEIKSPSLYMVSPRVLYYLDIENQVQVMIID